MVQAAPKINAWKPLLVTIIFAVGLVYVSVAASSRDFLWFISGTNDAEIVRIIMVDAGVRTVFQPGDAEFEAIRSGLNTSLSEIDNNNLLPIGLSDETIIDYDTKDTIMEIHYDEPIKFHLPFRTGEPDALLFPISGRHAGSGVFFRGDARENEWWYGGLRMADPAPLYNALAETGYVVDSN